MYNEIFALYWIFQYLAAPPSTWHQGGEGGGGGDPRPEARRGGGGGGGGGVRTRYCGGKCHGKEGHPPSRVNSHVSECLYEKKFAPLPKRRADKYNSV